MPCRGSYGCNTEVWLMDVTHPYSIADQLLLGFIDGSCSGQRCHKLHEIIWTEVFHKEKIFFFFFPPAQLKIVNSSCCNNTSRQPDRWRIISDSWSIRLFNNLPCYWVQQHCWCAHYRIRLQLLKSIKLHIRGGIKLAWEIVVLNRTIWNWRGF